MKQEFDQPSNNHHHHTTLIHIPYQYPDSMFEEYILQQFEDLLSDDSTIDITNNDEDSIDNDDVSTLKKLDANSLTIKDLLHEMEIRNLQPKGFFDDDAKLLQATLDKEHEEYLKSKRREKLQALELEAEQAMIRRRKALLEIEIAEEKREIDENQRVNEWFRLIQNRCSPTQCRIEVNNISVRTLARLLWSDDLILSLDVSNMNLSDNSGAYLARILKNNRSIVKLEMNENCLGYKTCVSLADSLVGTTSNTVLKFLSIGSNPLTAKNGKASIEALVTIIRENTSLRHLGLWRCNIGIEGGREICEAILSNECLTCIDLGYNFWDYSITQKIEGILVSINANI